MKYRWNINQLSKICSSGRTLKCWVAGIVKIVQILLLIYCLNVLLWFFSWMQLVMHLFSLSMTTDSTMCVQSSAHQTTYNSFWWGQGAKILNIFKNNSWHIPLCPLIQKLFYKNIKLGLSIVQTLSYSQEQVLWIAFRRNAIHSFSKTLSP